MTNKKIQRLFFNLKLENFQLKLSTKLKVGLKNKGIFYIERMRHWHYQGMKRIAGKIFMWSMGLLTDALLKTGNER